jgi:hypothetical protein
LGGERTAFEGLELFSTQALRQSVRLLEASLEIEVVRMLESIVELLGALSFSALTALVGTCIVGSTVAALRAVSRGSATVNTKK